MKNLYIDFDGVICNTIEVTYQMIKNANIDPKDVKKVTIFYQHIDWDAIIESSTAINDAWECIQKLVDSKKFNISILTHVISLEEAVAKIKYIRKYSKHIAVIPVPKQISKTKMVDVEGSILVDDYVNNLIEWDQNGGISIRFDLDMDGKGYKVIDKLDQLLPLVDTI